jgi:DNA-directed RNA polymerase specialized sigma subunit
VIGRIYNTKKMAQGRPRKDEKEVKLTSFSGSDATAKEVAEEVGVSEVTVRRAGKFAEAVAALERISPKAAEIVRRDEVRDAKTQLPKCRKRLCRSWRKR